MWVADHSDARERCAALDILNGRLALLESGGVGIGALAGGLLASLDASYALLICAVVGATACVLVGGGHPVPARRAAYRKGAPA